LKADPLLASMYSLTFPLIPLWQPEEIKVLQGSIFQYFIVQKINFGGIYKGNNSGQI
jgi:hypothetical protein